MKFKKDFLVDELDLPYSAIEDKIIDTSRWSEIHEIVFEFNGKFYQTDYSCGATECQDEAPFEYSDNELECIEVELKEVMVEKWVPVKAEEE